MFRMIALFLLFSLLLLGCTENASDPELAEAADTPRTSAIPSNQTSAALLLSELTGGTNVGNPVIIEQDMTGGTHVGNPIAFDADDEASFVKYISGDQREEIERQVAQPGPRFLLLATDDASADAEDGISSINLELRTIGLQLNPPDTLRPPKVLTFPLEPGTMLDLIAVAEGHTSILSFIEPENGIYHGLAIVLGENNTLVLDGEVYPLIPLMPALLIMGMFVIDDQASYLLVLDFNAEESILSFGDGTYYLRPFIHIRTLVRHQNNRYEILYHQPNGPMGLHPRGGHAPTPPPPF